MGPFSDGWTADDVDTVLRRADPAELLYVPIIVGMQADVCGPAWAEQTCLGLTTHADPVVRGNAMLGLGHVARTSGALRDRRSLQAIAHGLQDGAPYVREQAAAAADDITHFLGAAPEVLLARMSPDQSRR